MRSTTTSSAATPNWRAPAPRARPQNLTMRRKKGHVVVDIAPSSTSSSSSPSPSPLSGLLSFLKGKPDASEPPPGITFVSGRGREAIEDPSEVAALWRSSGFVTSSPAASSSSGSSSSPLPPPRSLSELTTGLPICGSDERRVALGIRYTWRVVAAIADDDEEGGGGEEERESGDGDTAAAAAGDTPSLLLPRPRRKRKKLVGLARLLSDGSFAAHLSDVVVDPDYRNRGVGRALVAAALKEALRRGPAGDAASSVVSWARPGRPRLFLQRCGFRVSVAYRVLRYEGDLMD